uniref:Uncharacterized protein n=1 Tax=Anguilla anguilla TaxID=7936 RepID=A0A0E9WX84_ANGAN
MLFCTHGCWNIKNYIVTLQNLELFGSGERLVYSLGWVQVFERFYSSRLMTSFYQKMFVFLEPQSKCVNCHVMSLNLIREILSCQA